MRTIAGPSRTTYMHMRHTVSPDALMRRWPKDKDFHGRNSAPWRIVSVAGDRLCGPGRERKEGGEGGSKHRMPDGGSARGYPRVNQRVRHYRMVVDTESDVEAKGLLL
jgi:hypothetical protein